MVEMLKPMSESTEMKINLQLGLAIALAVSFTSTAMDLPVAPGPFTGTRDSLTNYSCPDWFRDAKFGIWAHWGPQAVPMEGDWYARKMYQQGTPQYNDHLARWGHPSTNGWKDIIPLWKAENWDPEKLIELYKKAGAKYFVSMGSHHDDFFLWNSKLHKWNAVQVGPHRDVVGEWQAAAKKNGLPFGVSEHLGASFSWFQDSHKSDKTGPLAGVPYDGANSNNWDLYHFPAAPDDKSSWYTKDPRWQQQWYYEIKELVDNYHPDLLYSDGPVVFGNEVGLSQIANLYNLSAADVIKASAPARIVNVSSGAHTGAREINFADTGFATGYSGWSAYSHSKLANVLFTFELARRLEGSGVTANVLHPGFVATGFGANNGGLMGVGMKVAQRIMARSPEKGAETNIYLASSPEVEGVTGKYFTDKHELKASPAAYDLEAAKRLWALSEEQTKITQSA